MLEEQIVERLLGRKPMGDWAVCLYDSSGIPLVIETYPIFDDGTPMPTTFWLVGKNLRQEVSRVESRGGVKWADSNLDPVAISGSHSRYKEYRDAKIVARYVGARPTGGVAGTRRGVKCLHAHVAWHLVGGDDPVGAWTLYAITQLDSQEFGPVEHPERYDPSSKAFLRERFGL